MALAVIAGETGAGMEPPGPPNPEQPGGEPRWWVVSDWSWDPPERTPASLPAIHWHAPLFDPESRPTSSGSGATEAPGASPLVPLIDDEATQGLLAAALDWERVATPPERADGSRRSGGGRVRLGVKIATAAPAMLLIVAIATVYAFAR